MTEETVVDIGRGATSSMGRLLGLYYCHPKRLKDGKHFNLYAGFYYWLLTGKVTQRFLRARTVTSLEIKSNYTWVQVPDLHEQLANVLEYNLRESPMALKWLTRTHYTATWEGELSKSEQRWLDIVNQVLTKMFDDGESKRKTLQR